MLTFWAHTSSHYRDPANSQARPIACQNHRSHQLSRKSYCFSEVSVIFIVFLHRVSGHCYLHLFSNLCLPHLLPLATCCSLLPNLRHVSDSQLLSLSENPCAWPCPTLPTLRSWTNSLSTALHPIGILLWLTPGYDAVLSRSVANTWFRLIYEVL